MILNLFAADPAGLPSLAVYGVAAFPISLLVYAVKWCFGQMKEKDQVITQLNTRIAAQGESALAQAERMLPLLTEANRILALTVDALNDADPSPRRRVAR